MNHFSERILFDKFIVVSLNEKKKRKIQFDQKLLTVDLEEIFEIIKIEINEKILRAVNYEFLGILW